ncbi:winged helix-turn-helix domain-containing protein [Paenibacillus guangzhouensis]|uniref:winged helix-turn-helix domain-containing protein n=1 Tax=Paenibacillus guangzhouensis TaxID=1473112 RepID=UPI001266F5A7|nr:helix-turn-helix domain-containing protein [Paenibacillus guangzhouensis]
MQLELRPHEYIAAADGLTVTLLPKEFALLQFLYRNKGLTFSREQLLDQVWPLEYPSERTVDDHVYRLRKKLRPFADVEIASVRGIGYRLTVRQRSGAGAVNPTTHDAELHKTMRDVFGKYHTYGQGHSMLTLARQQDVLGYELDPFYSVYIHFVQGDLSWLINTNEAPLSERFYYLLLFYSFTGDPKLRLAVCEEVLEKGLLAPAPHREMEILNILELFTLAGEVDRALERINVSHAVIAELGYANFVPQTAITEMFVHLIAGTEDGELTKMAEVIEGEILTAKPFLREIGSYRVVKGLWMLRCQAWREAEMLIDEGLEVLERSGFVPMRLYALNRIRFICSSIPTRPSLQQKYADLYEEAQERIGLHALLAPLETLILGEIKRP